MRFYSRWVRIIVVARRWLEMMDFGTRGGQILSSSFGKSIQGLLFVGISKNCGFLLSRVSEAVIAHHVGCSGELMTDRSVDMSCVSLLRVRPFHTHFKSRYLNIKKHK